MPIFGVTGEIENLIRLYQQKKLARFIIAISKLYLKTEVKARMQNRNTIDKVVVQFSLGEGLTNTNWGIRRTNEIKRITLEIIDKARKKRFNS